MANIIIKSDEQRAYETRILQSFRPAGAADAEAHDAARYVAARVGEAYTELKKMDKTNRKEI